MEPYELSAVQAAALIAKRDISCEELIRSCLKRIDERDSIVRAWSYIDGDLSVRVARNRDNSASQGQLHGLPIGFKDIIATADMPTSHNSALYFGHQPNEDASCVAIIRHSGGLVFGKTDTVEFASGGRRALTRNPHNLRHTPGGSSSGSAAAVADSHVPLAVGTQTGGSVIRPAAFNGIYGFKPTHGLVSYAGAKSVAPSLDTIGWFARTVEDLRIAASAFALPANKTSENSILRDLPRVGLYRGSLWPRAEPAAREAFDVAVNRLAAAGFLLCSLELPSEFDRLTDAANEIVDWERRATLRADYLKFGTQLDQSFHDKLQRASALTVSDARNAYDVINACRSSFDAVLFNREIDVVLTLSAGGEAPEGLHGTGDSVFNIEWTALHVPCLAIPVGLGGQGLPLGIQIVGPRFSDERLIEAAHPIARAIDQRGAYSKLTSIAVDTQA